ncbi:MAG: head GIN domain-containing protein [Acidimicrobiia bacterium]
MRSVAATFVALLLFVTACSGDGDDDAIRGSGTLIIETRTVGGFDQISLEGFGEVIVEVGPAESLTIKAEDNVMPYLVTETDGRTLEIKVKDGTSFRGIEGPVYTITLPDLVTVSISGSGNVTAIGVDTDSFEVSIAGSGNVDFAGSVDALTVSIAGSGDFRGEELVAAEAAVSIGGSGSVLVNATDNLDVTIGGSGDVTYLGSPTLTMSIGGSGTVKAG